MELDLEVSMKSYGRFSEYLSRLKSWTTTVCRRTSWTTVECRPTEYDDSREPPNPFLHIFVLFGNVDDVVPPILGCVPSLGYDDRVLSSYSHFFGSDGSCVSSDSHAW